MVQAVARVPSSATVTQKPAAPARVTARPMTTSRRPSTTDQGPAATLAPMIPNITGESPRAARDG